MAGNPNDISPLDVLVEELELLFPEIVFPYIELDLTRLVAEIGKDGLSMVPDNVDSSSGRYALRTLVVRYVRVPFFDVSNRILTVERRGKDRDSFLLKRSYFIEPCYFKRNVFEDIGHLKSTTVSKDGYVIVVMRFRG